MRAILIFSRKYGRRQNWLRKIRTDFLPLCTVKICRESTLVCAHSSWPKSCQKIPAKLLTPVHTHAGTYMKVKSAQFRHSNCGQAERSFCSSPKVYQPFLVCFTCLSFLKHNFPFALKCSGEFNRGVSGVLSYEVSDTDYKVAIMWHISSDGVMRYNVKVRQGTQQIVGRTSFATCCPCRSAKIPPLSAVSHTYKLCSQSYPIDYTTNENLYNHMMESAGPWAPEEDWSEFHVSTCPEQNRLEIGECVALGTAHFLFLSRYSGYFQVC